MVILVIMFMIIDMICKLLAKRYLVLEKSIIIIKNFLSLNYAKNTGAAWSILSDNGVVVSIIASLIIAGLIYYLWKNKPNNRYEKLCYAMILAGAMGNLLCRIIYGYVIDYISITIFGYNWPIFNLADIFIVLGVLGLIVYTWRVDLSDTRSNRK